MALETQRYIKTWNIKVYDWHDILIMLNISTNKTYAQRSYIVKKVRIVLSDEDYILKTPYIDECLFRSSAIKKIQAMLKKARFFKRKHNYGIS